ncbi:MAG: group 1 glycosyl transferase, partial [Bacteroidota bacterium]
MVLLSHPMGNANVRAIAAALERNEMLDSFHTSIATFPGNLWDRLGGVSPLADFRRRSFATNLRQKTHQYPYRELGRMVSAKAGLASLSAGEKGPFCVDRVYHSLDRKVAAYLGSRAGQDVRMVYAYEDGALASFQAAKKRGIACIYDLPIAYWGTGHRLLEEEAERLPEWAVTLGGGISDSARKRQRKDEELALADAVVGPGSFVMDSLPAWASNKQRIVAPFGSPQVHSPAPAAAPNATTTLKNRPLRVLFAGSMGQRKGLGDLFAAVRSLPAGSIELVVLGGPQAPMSFYRQQYADFRHEGRRPHAEVLQ